MKKTQIFLTIFIVYILINMVIFPSVYLKQTFNGISAWAFNVLPSVLPFIFFVKLLTSLGSLDKLSKSFQKPCKLLFKTPAVSSLVFFTSIISGYPVGAKMTAELFEQGKISKSDAFKMCSFCSTSGPMFIIGTVGISMLKNAMYGYIIFVSHILGAIVNGILYRNLKLKKDTIKDEISPSNQTKFNLSSIVIDSALSIISVGVIIAVFFVVITSLSPLFNLFPPQISCILEGVIEITKGCIDISLALPGKLSIVAASFVISFGGISTILQSISMLAKLEMPVYLLCIQKFTHAIFAAIISAFIAIML